MNLLSTILESNGGNIVQQLSRQFGVNENQARSAAGQLIPALARGVQKNVSSADGLAGLLGALQGGSHEKYLDNPNSLADQDTVSDGNSILGHILGSKDVSRNVASHAAGETGLDASMLKKMLPVVAALSMGAMSKKLKQGELGNIASLQSGSSAGGLGMFASFLDADKDGSVMDDVLGLAKKFF